MDRVSGKRDGFWKRIIAVVSVLGVAAITFLFLGPRPDGLQGSLDVSALPTVNASLNAATLVLLLFGFGCVRVGRVELHRRAMLGAFATSAGFLTSYVIYHTFKAGPAKYVGEHRGIYFTILITHILLAAAILPLALTTLYRGWQDQRAQHKRAARVTLPIWIYVSVTGVVIYWMLY